MSPRRSQSVICDVTLMYSPELFSNTSGYRLEPLCLQTCGYSSYPHVFCSTVVRQSPWVTLCAASRNRFNDWMLVRMRCDCKLQKTTPHFAAYEWLMAVQNCSCNQRIKKIKPSTRTLKPRCMFLHLIFSLVTQQQTCMGCEWHPDACTLVFFTWIFSRFSI